jgi:hypothetical protein
VRQLDVDQIDGRMLHGDGRPLMRHSDGAMHAAVVDTAAGDPQMTLVGFENPREAWRTLAERIGPEGGRQSEPATDSNQNGAYVAYVEGDDAATGSILHIPDVFGAPEVSHAHGSLTPADRNVRGSSFQASRGYNSVIYGWRDDDGGIYVGVSEDGQTFPEAKLLTRDAGVVNGPAIGIYGDYAIACFVSSDPRFAPAGADRGAGEHYYAWCESGDCGETWSEPAPLIPSVNDLPFAVAHSVRGGDLVRHEVMLSGATDERGTLQSLVWANSPVDSRLFAELALTPKSGLYGEDWGAGGNRVGVLAWKRIELGGKWRFVLTNRSLFQRDDRSKEFEGRKGEQYKYCALPGTAIRVVAYVDKAVEQLRASGEQEDQLVFLMSTNMGDSFDHETTFSASELGLPPDAEAVIANSLCCYIDAEGDIWQDLLVADARAPEAVFTATLPIGINVAGFDPTMHW